MKRLLQELERCRDREVAVTCAAAFATLRAHRSGRRPGANFRISRFHG